MPEPDRPRCAWATSTPDYVAYHDDEWGRELHGEPELFERLSLEAFQSGLSWLIILRKRPAFRAAFAGFDLDAVARFDDADVQRLLADAGIVRNRAKIAATIANARAIRAGVPEGLDELLWSFAPSGPRSRPRTLADVPATSDESRGHGQGTQAAGPALRRSDHGLRAHAGHGDGRRPRGHVLAGGLTPPDPAAPGGPQWPRKTGFCLATNAAVASRWSSVAPMAVCSSPSRTSAASRSWSAAYEIACLMAA